MYGDIDRYIWYLREFFWTQMYPIIVGLEFHFDVTSTKEALYFI